MFSRLPPALLAFGSSVLILAGLLTALYWTQNPDRSAPLLVYCAESLRPTMTTAAENYQKEFGQRVEVRFGPSAAILTSLEVTGNGDLFLPADDSYIQTAITKEVVRPGDVFNLARMQAVVIVNPKLSQKIATWDDFLASGLKIGIGNDATAIGAAVKKHLESIGKWDALARRKPNELGTVNEVLNSVRLGSIDVGIVWDAVAHAHADIKVVKLKELAPIEARVQAAVVKYSKQRDNAIHFVRYLRASDKGAPLLKTQGFSEVEERGPMDERVELLVHAGAMLRPALEEAIVDFEKRENVRIIRVYNGCGILVSQMKTGETPDVYFSCDTTFMNQVTDRFETPSNVSNNQLMIAVKKGNPHKIHELADLGKPGLRVGVGHEQNCALGALTKETFVTKGVYSKVIGNIKVTSPTGDALVNQLRVGSLDVVIAYRTNIAPFLEDLEGFPIEGIKCATPTQPIAVSKSTSYPEMSKRLMDFLKTQESRQRFEKLGFGWEVQEAVTRKN